MRFLTLLMLVTAAGICLAAPQSKLQVDSGSNPQFIEEVVVESVLHVRNPATAAGRQARTNTKVSLQDGARVSESKGN